MSINNLPTTSVCGYTMTTPELDKVTRQLIKLSDNIKSNYVKMGALFIKVRDENLFVGFPTARKNDDGTPANATLADYADECFGLSKSALYRMISVTERVYQPLLQLQAEGCSDIPGALLALPDSSLNAMSGFGGYDGLADFIHWINDQRRDLPNTVRGFSALCHEYTDYLDKQKTDEENTTEAPQEISDKEEKREAVKATVAELQDVAAEIREQAETGPEEIRESFEEAVFDLLQTIGGETSVDNIHGIVDHFKNEWFINAEGSDDK